LKWRAKPVQIFKLLLRFCRETEFGNQESLPPAEQVRILLDALTKCLAIGRRFAGHLMFRCDHLASPLSAGKMARRFWCPCKLSAHNDLLAKSVLPGELRFGK
jgi:hypothetical protein